VNASENEPGIAEANPAQRPPIFTIGYGARTLDDFIAVLKANRIEMDLLGRSPVSSRKRYVPRPDEAQTPEP